ncbi:MAG: hypothetical protein AAGJ83_06785 [Planctomycetota bacterium]
MRSYRLRLRDGISEPIDASSLSLQRFSGLTKRQIESTEVGVDGRQLPLAELFHVLSVDPGSSLIEVEGNLNNVHGLAAEMESGEFRIHGDVGDGVGSGMKGGIVVIDGNAGDTLGGPLPNRKSGMSGGQITVTGDAGAYTGHRMRRGTVLVIGKTGKHLAASMIAGTVLAKASDDALAVNMRRGTLVLTESPRFIESGGPVRFSDPVSFEADYLRLYRQQEVADFLHPLIGSAMQRVRADLSVGGQGEVLFPA